MSGTLSAPASESSGSTAFVPCEPGPSGAALVTVTLLAGPLLVLSPRFAGAYVVVPLFCGAMTIEPPLSAGMLGVVPSAGMLGVAVSGPKPCAPAAAATKDSALNAPSTRPRFMIVLTACAGGYRYCPCRRPSECRARESRGAASCPLPNPQASTL